MLTLSTFLNKIIDKKSSDQGGYSSWYNMSNSERESYLEETGRRLTEIQISR
jgi:hypothetical protein